MTQTFFLDVEALTGNPEDFETLDEEGFIFLHDGGVPYLCRMWGESPWLFYWHPEKHWVSLKELTQADIFRLPHNLSEKEQALYRKLHAEWVEKMGVFYG